MWRIRQCGGAGELAELLARRRRHLNAIHVAAALTRLVRLREEQRQQWQRPQEQQEQQEQEWRGHEQALLPLLLEPGAADAAAPTAAAAAAQAATMAGGERAVVRACLDAMLAPTSARGGPGGTGGDGSGGDGGGGHDAAIEAIGARELATALWALARLGWRLTPAEAGALTGRALALAEGGALQPLDAAMALPALARLRLEQQQGGGGGEPLVLDAEWRRRLVRALLPALPGYPPRALAATLHGLARCGPWPAAPEEAAPLLAALARRLPAMPPRDVAVALWAVAAGLRLRPPPELAAAWLRAALRALPEMSGRELVAATVALARGGVRPSRAWLARLHGQLYWTADQFGGGELAAVAWSLGRVQARVPPELARRLLGYAALRLAQRAAEASGPDWGRSQQQDGSSSSSNRSSNSSSSSHGAHLETTTASGVGGEQEDGTAGPAPPRTAAPARAREVALLLTAHAAARLPLEAVPGGPDLHWRLLAWALPAASARAFGECAWALATMGYSLAPSSSGGDGDSSSGGGLHAFAARLAEAAGEMGPQTLALSAWAVAKLGSRGGAREQQQQQQQSAAGDGSDSGSGDGDGNVDDDSGGGGTSAALQSGGGLKQRRAAPRQGARPVWARDEPWVAAVVARSAALLPAMGHRELCALATGLALARAGTPTAPRAPPPPPTAWSAALCRRLLELAPALPGPALVKALTSLARLGVAPPARLLAALAARLEALEAQRGLSPKSAAAAQLSVRVLERRLLGAAGGGAATAAVAANAAV